MSATAKQTGSKGGPKEKRFLEALRALFVGVEVKGESGYVNLMGIKARYFTGLVEPQLQEDIAEGLKPFPAFREELFDKLHAFFSRYFSRSGSICFAYTPRHFNVHERIYSDERDVALFWKTHMLYYVKTDRLFTDLKVEVDEHRFFFSCDALKHKQANEKRELVHTLDKVEKDGTIRLTATYSEKGRRTKPDEILKELKKKGVTLSYRALEKAMAVFARQSEVDYFINKDARGFLAEQFDLWMYEYVFKDETHWTETRVRQLQALKEIALKLVDFIAQFEDELARIWNKPKFVRGSHYVVSLNRLAEREGGLEIIAKLIQQAGMKAQVTEWVELGLVEKGFDPKSLLAGKGKSRELAVDTRFLPLDTIHFPKAELEILALFDDLDEQLDGRLIKSENYQALNTLREKYKGRVKTFYIDPPYNTGEDEFAYIDAYRRSSWLSMISDRLSLGRDLLEKDGVCFASIGTEEIANLKLVFEQVYGETNWIAELVWEKGRKNDAKFFSVGHDYILVYGKSKAELVRKKRIWREEKPGAREILVEYRRLLDKYGEDYPAIQEGIRNFYKSLPEGHLALKYRRYSRVDANGIWRDDNISWPGGGGPRYDIIHPKTKKNCAVPDGGWRFSTQEKFHLYLENGFIEFREDHTEPPQLKRYLNFVSTAFDPDSSQQQVEPSEDEEEVNVQVMPSIFYRSQQPAVLKLRDLMGRKETFRNPKDPGVIARLLKYVTDPGEMVGDYFLGSGSTGEAVFSLFRENGGRKFLFVEAADYVDDLVLPRLKKLMWSDSWDSGKPKDCNPADVFFKVSTLEQYEEALGAAEYEGEQGDLFRNTKSNVYAQYLFFRDLKMARALELDYEKDEVEVDLTRLYPDIDLAETLSCVTGKWIKRVTAESVVFQDGTEVSLTKPDWRLLKPLIFWGPVE